MNGTGESTSIYLLVDGVLILGEVYRVSVIVQRAGAVSVVVTRYIKSSSKLQAGIVEGAAGCRSNGAAARG